MIAFIDAHREVYGVEPICGFCRSHRRPTMSGRPAGQIRGVFPQRTQRDARLRAGIRRVWEENSGSTACARSGSRSGGRGSRSFAARRRG